MQHQRVRCCCPRHLRPPPEPLPFRPTPVRALPLRTLPPEPEFRRKKIEFRFPQARQRQVSDLGQGPRRRALQSVSSAFFRNSACCVRGTVLAPQQAVEGNDRDNVMRVKFIPPRICQKKTMFWCLQTRSRLQRTGWEGTRKRREHNTNSQSVAHGGGDIVAEGCSDISRNTGGSNKPHYNSLPTSPALVSVH